MLSFLNKEKKYKKLYVEKLKEYRELLKKVDPYNLNPAPGELREFQLKTFDFCYQIIQTIESLDIPYFPIGGTLIGLIRNQDFIPWDDDFDIGLMRKDYIAFQKYCEENYIVIDPKEINLFPHNRSSVWQKYLKKYPNQIIYSLTPRHIQILKGTNLQDCVNIDIFPHDCYSEEYKIEDLDKFFKDSIEACKKISNYRNVIDYLNKMREENKNIVEKSSRVHYGNDNIDIWLLKCDNYFEYDKIFPLKRYKFCNREIYAQNDLDHFAANQYKDYKSLPKMIDVEPHRTVRNYKSVLNFKKIDPDNILENVVRYKYYLGWKNIYERAYKGTMRKIAFMKHVYRKSDNV